MAKSKGSTKGKKGPARGLVATKTTHIDDYGKQGRDISAKMGLGDSAAYSALIAQRRRDAAKKAGGGEKGTGATPNAAKRPADRRAAARKAWVTRRQKGK